MAFDTKVAAAIADLKNQIDTALDGSVGGFEKASLLAESLARFTTSINSSSAGGGATPYPTANAAISAGGTAQTALSGGTRKAIEIQNQSVGDLWFRFGGIAANGTGLLLVPGQSWQNPPGFVPDGTVSIWGATTGQAFSVTQG
jgi:hypothetical protein